MLLIVDIEHRADKEEEEASDSDHCPVDHQRETCGAYVGHGYIALHGAKADTVAREVDEEPKRAKLRNDNELPKCRKSNTDAAEPQRAKLRNDNELPKCKKSNTDIEEPKRCTP